MHGGARVVLIKLLRRHSKHLLKSLSTNMVCAFGLRHVIVAKNEGRLPDSS